MFSCETEHIIGLQLREVISFLDFGHCRKSCCKSTLLQKMLHGHCISTPLPRSNLFTTKALFYKDLTLRLHEKCFVKRFQTQHSYKHLQNQFYITHLYLLNHSGQKSSKFQAKTFKLRKGGIFKSIKGQTILFRNSMKLTG